MALLAKPFAFSTGTGGPGTTIAVSGLGFQPEVLLLWWTGQDSAANAVSNEDRRTGVGVVLSPTNRRCVFGQDDHAADPTATDSGHRTDAAVAVLTPAGADGGRLDLQSFDADGFTMVVDAPFAASMRVHGLALAGDVTQAYLGSLTEPATAGTVDYTDAGFEPDLLLFFGTSLTSAPPATGPGYQLTLGLASGATEQGVVAIGAQDGAATTVTKRYIRFDECLALYNAGVTALDWRASLAAVLPTGFRLTHHERASSRIVHYLALKGPTAKVGIVNTRTNTTTPIAVTGLGFAPKAVVFLAHGREQQAADTPVNHAHLTLGVGVSGTDRQCAVSVSDNAAPGSEVTLAVRTDAVYGSINLVSALIALMDLVSLDSDGFTCQMTLADFQANPVLYLALGDGAGLAETTGTGAGTLPAPHGASAGAHGVAGAGALALPALEADVAGAHGVAGTAALALPSLTAEATGAHGVAGAGAGSLLALLGTAGGEHVIAGQVLGLLPALGGAGLGAAGLPPLAGFRPAPLPVSISLDIMLTLGTGAGTLPALAGAAQGDLVVFGGAAGLLPAVVGAASSESVTSGQAAGLLPAVVGTSEGGPAVVGVGAGTLPAFLASGGEGGTSLLIGVNHWYRLGTDLHGGPIRFGTGVAYGQNFRYQNPATPFLTEFVPYPYRWPLAVPIMPDYQVEPVPGQLGAPPVITGQAAAVLPALLAMATGMQQLDGVAAARLPAVTALAQGAVGAAGQATGSLGAVTGAAEGEVVDDSFDPTIYLGPTGTVYWVAQNHPLADDANPGTEALPWKTISKAAATLQPGDVVVIRAGTYREFVQPQRGGTSDTNRITYIGYPGEPVVISGAEIETTWTQEGNLWWTPYTDLLPVGPPDAAYGEPAWLLALHREQAIEDGIPLREVATKEELVPGTFWHDGRTGSLTGEPLIAPTRLYVRLRNDDSPHLHTMEISRRNSLFAPASGVQWLRIKNLTFRYSTDQYHQTDFGIPPTISLGTANGLMEDCVVEWLNLRAFYTNGTGHVWRRVIAQDNGMIGWAGGGTNLLLEDCKAFRNNWKMTAPGGEAGATKFAHSTNVVVRRFESAHNNDCGVWWDINNNGGVLEDSLIYDNLRFGVLLELNSNNIIVRNNVVFGTRLWTWDGASVGGGIVVQGSSNNTIVHNTVYGNDSIAPFGGISLGYEDHRADTLNNRVFNNISAFNGFRQYGAFGTWTAGGNLAWGGPAGHFNPIVADPKLADPNDPHGWHIAADSGARGIGVTPPVSVPTDREGDARTHPGADAGADEFTT